MLKLNFKPQGKNVVCSRFLTPGLYAGDFRRTYDECQKLKSLLENKKVQPSR